MFDRTEGDNFTKIVLRFIAQQCEGNKAVALAAT